MLIVQTYVKYPRTQVGVYSKCAVSFLLKRGGYLRSVIA